MTDVKGEIRAVMRQRRKAVGTEERVAASAKICKLLGEKVKVKGEGEQRNNKNPLLTLTFDHDLKLPTTNYQLPTDNFTIAVYLASPDEIDLTTFIEQCLSHPLTLSPSHPLRLVAPKWNGTDYELAELNGCWRDKLVRGPHGILEPPKDAPRVEASEVCVWIVPGLAFTKDGARLGYGGGWYDRLMSGEKVKVKGEGEQRRDNNSSVHLFSSPSPYHIGVGYRFQVVDALPAEPHDVMLDEIVTD